MIRLRADERVVTSSYLAAALKSERTHRSLRERAKGLAGSMPKIDQSAIASTLIPVPPIDTQNEIVRALAAQREVEQRCADNLRNQAKREHILRRSLLSAAFSSGLMGQAGAVGRAEELVSAGRAS